MCTSFHPNKAVTSHLIEELNKKSTKVTACHTANVQQTLVCLTKVHILPPDSTSQAQ